MLHRVAGEDRRVRVSFTKPSRTKQSFKDQSNINNIMRKHQKTGVLDHFSRYQGEYGDFSGPPDYQECLNKVLESHSMFMTLPSSLRKRFENDPALFLDFISNESNRDEARSLGLLKPDVKEDVAPPAPSTEA